MANQCKALPAELICHCQHISHMIHQVGYHPVGAMVRVTMTGKIQCHHGALPLRRQRNIGRGIVQPAMQGQHRLALAVPAEGGQSLSENVKFLLFCSH